MKPYIHAKNSARKFGGDYTDYLPIHNEMDCSKSAMPDVRHRSIYHSAFGIYIIEKIFGEVITNSDGKKVSVRDIAEEHVVEDLGFIPTLQDYLVNMQIQDWMIRPAIRERFENDQKEEQEIMPDESFNDIDGESIIDDLSIVLDSKTEDVSTSKESTKEIEQKEEKDSLEELKQKTSHIMSRGAEILEKWRKEGRLISDKPEFEKTKKIGDEIKHIRRRRNNRGGSFPWGNSPRLD